MGRALEGKTRECVKNELEALIKQLEREEERCRRKSMKDNAISNKAAPIDPIYLHSKRPRYNRDLQYVPLITYIPILEIRPTAERSLYYSNPLPNIGRILYPPPQSTHKYQPWSNRMRGKSIEIRGGTIYNNCTCDKHNGTQDQCERSGCGTCDCIKPQPLCLPGRLVKPQPTQLCKKEMVRQAVCGHERSRLPNFEC